MSAPNTTPGPCPFCGEATKIRHCGGGQGGQYHWYACDACEVEGPAKPTQADALNAWDTRAAAQELYEALEKCRDQFAFYASEHAAAGKNEKAATNQRFADLADAALRKARGEVA
jgi:Lar family restriction alleviation protein